MPIKYIRSIYQVGGEEYFFLWNIFSIKYGFLFPDDIVSGPYNVSFNDIRTNPITLKKLSSQVVEKRLDNFEKIVVLGGKNYVNIIKKVFSGRDIYIPLSDCKGIGYMISKLNDAMKRGFPLQNTLC